MQVRDRPIESTGADAANLAAGENFAVASRLLPRRQRAHLMAVYGYARLVDDIGDESAGDRLAELDWAEAELDRAFAGSATHPVLVRLQADDRGLRARAPAVRRPDRGESARPDGRRATRRGTT